MKNKRPPTMALGKIRLRYRQIPYNNRYIFIDWKNTYSVWEQIGKICYASFNFNLLPYEFFSENYMWQIDKFKVEFKNKIKKYDEYLDAND